MRRNILIAADVWQRFTAVSFLFLARALEKRRSGAGQVAERTRGARRGAGDKIQLTICQLRLVIAALISAGWSSSRERRGCVLRLIEYHQANIAASRRSHAKARKRRLRASGVVLGKCTRRTDPAL